MNFKLPSSAAIVQSFPQIQILAAPETGGFKAVYRISIEGKIEALKLMPIPLYEGSINAESLKSEMVGRIRREVESLSLCKGPEIVKLGSLPLTHVKIDNAEFAVYSEEFLEGHDLWKLLNSGMAKPSESELRQLFVTLLKAIKELWGHGYIHRDIKPKNVMKTPDPTRRFVLLDLGIAYCIEDTALTADPGQRLPLATHRYLAPELMNPLFRETIDFRSDLYTAAMTVYEFGAQMHPLAQSKDDLMQTISRALRQQPTPLSTLRNDLTTEFCQIIDQMLKKKPALRPANIQTIIQHLEQTP